MDHTKLEHTELDYVEPQQGLHRQVQTQENITDTTFL